MNDVQPTAHRIRARRSRPLRLAIGMVTTTAILLSLNRPTVAAAATTATVVPAAEPATPSTTSPPAPMVVVLKDQLPGLSAKSTARYDRAVAEQDAVLQSLPGVRPPAIKHYSVGNAFAATLTAAQSSYLRTQSTIAAVVPDSRVAIAPAPATAAASTPTRSPARHPTGSRDKNSQRICPSDPAKPLLEPEALTVIHAASTTHSANAQQLATGAGVKVAVLAEGLDPQAQDYLRPDGSSAIVDYQDFSGEGPGVAYGEEQFGDASSIAAQGLVVHDLSKVVSTTHPLPTGCNVQVRGVAPGASIVALKVLGTGNNATYAIVSNVLQAIDYAVNTDHVDVINESIGLAGYPDAGSANAIQLFNDQAIAAGVAVTVAIGDGGNTSTALSPGADPLVISAAASTTQRLAMQIGTLGTSLSNGHWINGQVGAFSSGGFTQSGTVPTLIAPGDSGWAVCTFDTSLPGCTDFNGNPSAIFAFGGASQAAPFTAGVIALMIEAYRNTHLGASPSPALLKRLLASTAVDLGAPSNEQGAGQLDALGAVRAAMHVGTEPGSVPGTSAGANVIASADQLTNVGAAGSPVTNKIKYTNVGKTAQRVTPTVRQLIAVSSPELLTRTITATSPALTDSVGATAQYTTTHFTVAKGVDRVAISLAYRSSTGVFDAGDPPLPFENAGGQITATLLAPDGSYVLSSRPQGGGNTGNYGNLDLIRPATGTWTLILSTKPGFVDILGGTFPTAPYFGPISISIERQRWITAGTVTPRTLHLAPGTTETIAVTSRLPLSGGDTAATISSGIAGQSTTIPLVQRVLIPTIGGIGQFNGGLTGGNGRSGSAAQTFTYAFDVTGKHRDLAVATHLDFPGGGSAITTILIDPNQQTHAVNNVPVDALTGTVSSLTAYNKDLTNYVANPVPGRWRLVIVANNPVNGDTLVVPFHGQIGFDRQRINTSQLPTAKRAIYKAGSTHTVNLTYTNTGASPLQIVVDPRISKVGSVNLGSRTTSMPLTVFNFLTLPDFVVPPLTTRLDAAVDSTVPGLTQISGPTSFGYLSGPSITGPIAPVVNGHSKSSASVAVTSGALSIGEWNVVPGQQGPYGANGAPAGSATVTAHATTNQFDPNVTSPTGNRFNPDATPGKPVEVAPNATIKIPITFTVAAPTGSHVTGLINLVTPGTADLLNKIIVYQVGTTGQLLTTIPFGYTVGP